MWPIISPSKALFIVLTMLTIVGMSVRIVQPEWWRYRIVRWLTLAIFTGLFIGLSIWEFGNHTDTFSIVLVGTSITFVGMIVLAGPIAVLPWTALVDRGLMFASKSTPEAPLSGRPQRLSRRALIRFGSASLPALAAATCASGFALSKTDPILRRVNMEFEGLHPDLEGFRILHLSDLHLGACLALSDLEQALTKAQTAKPDLIVLTGDLADDPSLIAGALALVARAGARYGALASLGNHEYLHDIKITRPHYEASEVPLLVSSGRTLRVGNAELFVAGADDPVHIGGDIAAMLKPSIEQAASKAPASSHLKLLLCHRPEGHRPAAAEGFDLTLSGHTHGGQLGLLGRSVFERLSPGTNWWGAYACQRPDTVAARRSHLWRAPSRLYTTSGFGHWFPFRLGCPTEMALVVLTGRKANRTERA